MQSRNLRHFFGYTIGYTYNRAYIIVMIWRGDNDYRKRICHSKSNSFVAAAGQVCLQPALEHRQRRDRRNIAADNNNKVDSKGAGDFLNSCVFLEQEKLGVSNLVDKWQILITLPHVLDEHTDRQKYSICRANLASRGKKNEAV